MHRRAAGLRQSVRRPVPPLSALRPPAGGPVPLVVAGHSHTRALQRAVEAEGPTVPGEPTTSVVCEFRGTYSLVRRAPTGMERTGVASLRDGLAATVAGADVAVCWRGNLVNSRSIVAYPPAFDVVLPDEPPGRVPLGTVIPTAAVEAAVRGPLADPLLAELLAAQRAGAVRRVALLVPPPPLPSDATRTRLATSPHFAAELARLDLAVDDAPLVPTEVRVRLWHLLVDAHRAFAADEGIDLVLPPADVAGEDGTLRAEYHDDDVTHANAAYGARYLAVIRSWAAEPVTAGRRAG